MNQEQTPSQQQRLVKFVAHAGICSRRKAEFLIKEGTIRVNGEVVTDPAHFVAVTDDIRWEEQRLKLEAFFYIALNKPRNVLCTAFDPNGKPTIFDVIKNHKLPKVRLYHVGRLDQTSTGLLIMTNDGDFCQRVAHPSCGIMKTYRVTLHKDLTPTVVDAIKRGIKLHDGFVKVDSISPMRSRLAHTFKVTLHSGKNRIIRRIFEHCGYFVKHLERTALGPISIKGIPTGQWRFLTPSEISSLQETAAIRKSAQSDRTSPKNKRTRRP